MAPPPKIGSTMFFPIIKKIRMLKNRVQIACESIGVRDHFRLGRGGGGGGGGGEAQHFLPESLILARKSNMFGQCIFIPHGGGGVGEEGITLLK